MHAIKCTIKSKDKATMIILLIPIFTFIRSWSFLKVAFLFSKVNILNSLRILNNRYSLGSLANLINLLILEDLPFFGTGVDVVPSPLSVLESANS